MGRSLSTDDEVLLEEASTPRFAEVWAFVSDGGEIVVHRCLWRRSDEVLFMGDGNRFADGFVTRARLIGRATTLRRRGRTTPVRRSRGLPAIGRWLTRAGLRRLVRPFR